MMIGVNPAGVVQVRLYALKLFGVRVGALPLCVVN